jgi:hypothetical protein
LLDQKLPQDLLEFVTREQSSLALSIRKN